MLLTHGTRRGTPVPALDTIHNYYEHLVMEQLQTVLKGKPQDNDYIADVACVALNQLPTRYIRHDVDMAFYLKSSERAQITHQVEKAVSDAIAFVDSRNPNNND